MYKGSESFSVEDEVLDDDGGVVVGPDHAFHFMLSFRQVSDGSQVLLQTVNFWWGLEQIQICIEMYNLLYFKFYIYYFSFAFMNQVTSNKS